MGYDRLLAAAGSTKPALCTSVAGLLASKYGEPFLRSNPDLRFYIWHKDVVESNGTVAAKQPPSARQYPYATADQVADAKQWIAAQAGNPWCVALNLITPHDPFHLPPPGTYRADTVTDPANPTVQELLVAMMESMDHYVGALLNAIDSQLGNTVVNRNIVFGNFGSAGNSWQMLFTVQAGGAPFANLRTDMPTAGSDPDQDLLGLTASTTLAAGVWRHVAYTFTWGADRVSPCCIIYVDGVEAGRASPTIVPNPKVRNPYQLMPSNNPDLIGRKQDTADGNSWFTGEMQSFRVYGVALDATRIQQLASA